MNLLKWLIGCTFVCFVFDAIFIQSFIFGGISKYGKFEHQKFKHITVLTKTGNIERQEFVRKNMLEQGLVEGEHWDFWFYLDG